jgi:hypothetical protein
LAAARMAVPARPLAAAHVRWCPRAPGYGARVVALASPDLTTTTLVGPRSGIGSSGEPRI